MSTKSQPDRTGHRANATKTLAARPNENASELAPSFPAADSSQPSRKKGRTQHRPAETSLTLRAGARPLPIVPSTLDEAMTLARAVVASHMAPSGLETPEACMIAILHGLEVGLTPLAALQRIAVIDGRPTIWGDAALALVRASGLCTSIRESVTGSMPEAWTAVCEVQRRGDRRPTTRTFSTEDARTAGLWNKPGPWTQYPRRMLQMRARAFALRDTFADVLGGLYLREEVDGAQQTEAPEPSRKAHQPHDRTPIILGGRTGLRAGLSTARKQGGLRAPGPNQIGQHAILGDEPSVDAAKLSYADHQAPAVKGLTVELLDDALSCAFDAETLTEIREEFSDRLSGLSREDRARAERTIERHAARVGLAARPDATP